MVAPIDVESSRHVVELGAGTGCVTRALLKRLRPDCKLTVIEANEAFARKLWELSDPRLSVFHARAENLGRFVKSADVIISSVPLAALPDEVAHRILAEIQQVKGVKKFVQFQYSRRSEGLFRTYFDEIERSRVLFNLPPAHVYVCTPKKM